MDKSKIRTPGQKCRLQCRQLYNSIFQYRNVDGIQLIDMFMHKPSKRDYPDYYDVSILTDVTFHKITTSGTFIPELSFNT